MAQLKHVKRARKAQGNCRKCGEKIKKGDAYKYADKRISWHGFASVRWKWHQGCKVRPSDLMGGFAAEVQAIREGIEDGIKNASTIGELNDVLQEGVSDVENLAEETRDKYNNMPEGLQQGDTGQLLEQRADALYEWAQELNSAADNLEEEEEEDDKKAKGKKFEAKEDSMEGAKQAAYDALESFNEP